MRILVDTREQTPLSFVKDDVLIGTQAATLKVGDYVAEFKDGSLCPIIFERKSISDLFGTLTSGYKRFRAELLRARELNVKLILAIEGTISDVLKGSDYSSVDGVSVYRRIMTLWVKYDLMPMFFENREQMAAGINEFYQAFGRNYKLKETK